MSERDTTHFGFQQVPIEEKAERVAGVFGSVAASYDLMNDVMSFGVHRLWKRYTVDLSGVRAGERVLDLAGGTGDLAEKFAERVGERGRVMLADINAAMLREGRERLVNRRMVAGIAYLQADAECLPFPDDYFDCVTMAFGLRNVTHKERALAAIYRVLKPGGRTLILEFSKPSVPGLQPLYDLYSFKVLPLMGKLIARDADSYRYLAESIRMHPNQEALKEMMQDAGFERCDYHNLSGGIVALHKGYKF